MYFPRSYEIWQLNETGRMIVVGCAIVGAIIGTVVAWRKRAAMRRRMPLALFALAVVVHAVTIWILIVDPHRNSGNIPLPFVIGLVAAWASVILHFAAPICGAYVLVRALLAFPDWRRRPSYVAFALMAAYAMYIAPWAVSISAD